MADTLFDLSPLPDAEPAEKLSADRARTQRRAVLLARGVHPATRLALRPEGGTCGNCARFLVVHHGRSRTWFKCSLRGDTAGAGSDIRKSWPACVKWEADRGN